MFFNSVHFLIFLPVVFFLYHLLPHKYRNTLLLVASAYFYMVWRPVFILPLLFSVSVDYFAALGVHRSAPGRRKKAYLAASLATNLLILFSFKYFNLFGDSVNRLGALVGHAGTIVPVLNLVLPLGISFYTFHAMSYAIDVYRGRVEPERSYFRYLLFVLFFPQMVAGPIARAQNMLGQFRVEHAFDYQRTVDGMKLAAWGMFKKVVIADRLAAFVDYVYTQPTNFTGPPLVIATIMFAFQIYCDFSGYSDIAIGTAQMFGFRLLDNFNRPYFSKSMAEFWKRWHISLSTWFKDYFYIPLGGNRCGAARHWLNLFLTFAVSGLWHGAKWTYLAWGALNGFYLLVSLWSADWRRKLVHASGLASLPELHKVFQIAYTFFLTCVAWVFFRSNGLGDAVHILTHSAVGVGEWWDGIMGGDHAFLKSQVLLGQSANEAALALIVVAFMEFVHLMQRHGSIRHMLDGKPWYVRWPLYVSLVTAIIIFGRFGERQFIYFTF